jgi:hypothetical protein
MLPATRGSVRYGFCWVSDERCGNSWVAGSAIAARFPCDL